MDHEFNNITPPQNKKTQSEPIFVDAQQPSVEATQAEPEVVIRANEPFAPNDAGHTRPGNIPPKTTPTNPTYDWNYEYYKTADTATAKTKNKGLIIFAVIITIFFLTTALSFGFYIAYENGWFSQLPLQQNAQNSEVNLNINDKPVVEETADADGKLTSVGIAKKVKPSVVGIVSYSLQQGLQGASSQGSGIIMSEDGYIITNTHVISGADAVKVVLFDNEEYEGFIIGSDERTDLAVVKIDATGLTAAEFGDSDKLQDGETVLAIGNPNGLSLAGSVTQGIISSTKRALNDSSAYATTFIQTDAAINPGNSGGALVDEYGFVIGINTAKISATDVEGIGFAIPINEAKPVVESLIQYGYVKDRVRLGITYMSIDETMARLNNVPSGLYIDSVDSTVDAYGKIAKGDIITKMDGQSVVDASDISKVLKDKKVGDSIVLTVYRRSARQSASTFEVAVKLSEDKGDITTYAQQQQQPEQSNGFHIFP